MRTWVAALVATGVLGGLSGCGSDRPADQQEMCSTSVNDAVNGDGGTVSTNVSVAIAYPGGTQHLQAMVDARAAAREWHGKLVAQADRDISPELRQVLNDGAAMVAQIEATLQNEDAVPPPVAGDIRRYTDKIHQACKDAWS
jgi:hypothetical protein